MTALAAPGGVAPRRARRYWRSRPEVALLASLAFFLAIYLYPLTRLVAWSLFAPGFTLAQYAKLFGEPAYMQALRNTAEISLGVTVLALVLGYPLAYLVTVVSARTRAVLILLVLVPFWTSVLVRTFAWMVILGKKGIVNQALLGWGLVDRPVPLIYNMVGVQIGMVHVLLPFMVFPLYSVMSRIDLNVIRVARSLGAPPHRVFLHVFLPLSLPGVAAGCLIVFLLAVGFYVTPALLGGPGQITLATMIDMMITTFLNFGFAATLGLLLLAVVAGIFAVVSALLGLNRIVGGRADS